jgi:hypothetical protein
LFHRPVKFPTAVTRKSLTGWIRLMGHQKAEGVVFRNGIRDFQSSANPRREIEHPFCCCSA